MKQVQPHMRQQLGANLDEKKFEDFKDDQIQQLYELFVEIKQFDPLKEKETPK